VKSDKNNNEYDNEKNRDLPLRPYANDGSGAVRH
jgi:hypothetical protein